eukprot:TRINITY_DN10058_c0_g1_i1.p1 TRINITY_DN10058_c0_g1~~TRINITY_DN10058_c0_g1_i1.p1  ORF type:complete len:575 (+),score=66.15 TRINITY_DN10058_c0_g1_i1:55-1779(+)
MVLLGEDALTAAYEKIREIWGEGRVPVQVLVGCDVDSVCSLKILMQLMLTDKVQPAVTPVQCHGDVERAIKEIPEDSASILMINCGANQDLSDIIPPDTTVHLVDSHRPVHLSNIEHESILVWQHGDVEEHFNRCKRISKKRRKRLDSEEDTPTVDDSLPETDDYISIESQYYASNWYGPPSSTLFCHIALDVMPQAPDNLLWYAAVSASHFFLMRYISHSDYDTLIGKYLLIVAQRNVHKPATEFAGEDLQEQDSYHTIRLESNTEQHLFLLRHNSLWDALVESSYVASRLRLYNTENGENQLRRLLHGQLGLKEEDCRVEWTLAWDAEKKEEVLNLLSSKLKNLGLTSFTFRSIIMKQGYNTGIAAPDLSRILSAVIAHPLDAEKEETRMQYFWMAYDIADNRRTAENFAQGLEIAKSTQAALVRQTKFLLQKEYIRNLGCFRYGFVNEASADVSYFVHPLTLLSLGYAIIDTLSEDQKSKRKPIPLLLLSYDRAANLYTMASSVPIKSTEAAVTPFGRYLRSALETAPINESDLIHDGFDPTTIKVAKKEARTLLDALAMFIHRQSNTALE